MAKNKKTAAELRAENRLLRRFGIGQSITKVIVAVVKWVSLAVMANSLFKAGSSSVEALAGRNTDADIDLSLGITANTNLEVTLSAPTVIIILSIVFVVVFSAVGYGLQQSKLRKDAIQRLSGFRHKYELIHDPNRSSSQLSERGDELPESDEGGPNG